MTFSRDLGRSLQEGAVGLLLLGSWDVCLAREKVPRRPTLGVRKRWVVPVEPMLRNPVAYQMGGRRGRRAEDDFLDEQQLC